METVTLTRGAFASREIVDELRANRRLQGIVRAFLARYKKIPGKLLVRRKNSNEYLEGETREVTCFSFLVSWEVTDLQFNLWLEADSGHIYNIGKELRRATEDPL